MTLYGIIFDWYWTYIWTDTNEQGNAALSDFRVENFMSQGVLSMNEWLCHTCTIITLIAMCVALFFVVKWLFKMFAGMISGVGR